jgi:ABC-type nitrate/sulfonate/bicarbonate transport system substrate-binding protein
MTGGGRSNTDLRFLCARYGLRPGIDVEVVRGDSVGRAKAFEDPTIAAVFARSQFLYWGTQAGFQPLNYPEPGMGWYEGGLAAGVSLLTRRPDLVQKVLSAVVRATAFTKENEKEAVDVALKRIPNLDRAEAEGNYRILRSGFVDNLEPSVIDYMSTVVGTIKESSRQATLEEVADLSFLHEAQRRAKS